MAVENNYMRINRDYFYREYRKQFGPLTQDLVDALNIILDAIESDETWTLTSDTTHDDVVLQKIAYLLATTRWETARTMRPIHEYGNAAYFERRYGCHTRVGKMLGNESPGDGAKYPGRGLVQLTGLKNYRLAEKVTGRPLVSNPDLACEPNVAYQIAVDGMTLGWYTGKKLDDYFRPGRLPDWTNARRIINGTDQAVKIGTMGKQFYKILSESLKA